MKRSLLNIIGFAVYVLPALPLRAQHLHGAGHTKQAVMPAPELKATVDKHRILIGEPIQLMLEATVHGDSSIVWPVLDSIPHFEWVEKNKVDSSIQPGQRYYRQYLTITSFDSGTWAIPQLPFTLGNKRYLTDSIRITMSFTKVDPVKEYHDIKEIIDIPNPFARWFGWIVAAISLASLALIVWLIRKKKVLKTLIRGPAPRLSPYEEALVQLDELERQHLVENGSVKLYYSRLGDILRLFVLRRLGISTLAETSEELIGQLRRQSLSPQQFTDLADTLRMSDFVKFAKYQPGLADTELHFRVIRSSVSELNRVAEEKEKAAAAPTPATATTKEHITK